MSDLVGRVETSWNELMQAAEGIPDERLAEPGAAGEWSVKDILAHVGFWEGESAQSLERRRTGQPRPASENDGEDEDDDTINDKQYRARRDWSAAQVREDLQRSHTAVVEHLRHLPELPEDEVAGGLWEHYAEHAATIREWRERAGV